MNELVCVEAQSFKAFNKIVTAIRHCPSVS